MCEVSVDPAARFSVRTDHLLFALMWKDSHTPLNSRGLRDLLFIWTVRAFSALFD